MVTLLLAPSPSSPTLNSIRIQRSTTTSIGNLFRWISHSSSYCDCCCCCGFLSESESDGERIFFFIGRVWIISIPYLVKFHPWRTGYYSEYLDQVRLDIHYSNGNGHPYKWVCFLLSNLMQLSLSFFFFFFLYLICQLEGHKPILAFSFHLFLSLPSLNGYTTIWISKVRKGGLWSFVRDRIYMKYSIQIASCSIVPYIRGLSNKNKIH